MLSELFDQRQVRVQPSRTLDGVLARRARRSARTAAVCVVMVIVVVVVAAGCATSSRPPRGDSSTTAAPVDPLLTAAISAYRRYVDAQVDALAAATTALVTAVDAGQRVTAQRLYPGAHAYYERIEPVAEILGKLDVDIDGRVNDFVAPEPFGGYHRIEQALWSGAPSTPGSAAQSVAQGVIPRLPTAELQANIAQLQRATRAVQYTPLELTNGATELLNEIEATKITGEEERYSHTDLVDIRANLDGAEEVVAVLAPALQVKSAALLATIRARFAEVDRGVAQYAITPGYDRSGYVRFSDLSTAQRRHLSDLVEAVAQPVSLITATLNS